MKNFPTTELFTYLLTGILLALLADTFLYSEEIYYNSISEGLTLERVERVLAFKADYYWLQYVLYILFESISLLFGTLLLCLGAFLFNLKLSFNKCLKVCIIGSFVFFLPHIIKIIWFTLVEEEATLAAIRSFYPLSLLTFFDRATLPYWLVYPIFSVSITRITYFVVLIIAMKKVFESSYKTISSLVLSVMGAWWLIWTVFIVFLSVLKS